MKKALIIIIISSTIFVAEPTKTLPKRCLELEKKYRIEFEIKSINGWRRAVAKKQIKLENEEEFLQCVDLYYDKTDLRIGGSL